MATQAPFGTWKSPIGADLIIQKIINLTEIIVDPKTREIYHIEARPSEAGRCVLVKTTAENNCDLFNEKWNARSRVHEYGGGAATVYDGVAYFANVPDLNVYKICEGGPVAVTPDNSNYRYSSIQPHPLHPHLLILILEDHTKPEPSEVINTIVVLNTLTKELTTLAKGADFYSSPTISPDGSKVAWIQWYHPDMPWEGSELYVASLDVTSSSITLKDPTHIQGSKVTESVSQPNWSSNNNALYFLSDKSGFYNPWVYLFAKNVAAPVLKLPTDEDFAEPAWSLSASSFCLLPSSPNSEDTDDTLILSAIRNGFSVLYSLKPSERKVSQISTSEQKLVGISHLHALSSTEIVFVGEKDIESPALYSLNFPKSSISTPTFKLIKQTSDLPSTLPEGVFPPSVAKTLYKKNPNEPLYIVYYPPTNPQFAPKDPQNDRPPAIFNVHGGPTGRAGPGLKWVVSYFTSRGWAWIDVNYGGSSGYGRLYRDRLAGQWGVLDVEDCIECVRQLGSGEGGLDWIDASKVAIRGSSSGGFTVLAALTSPLAVSPSNPDIPLFGAGTSNYGISSLPLLASDSHKFESKYMEGLLGGTIEEKRDVYVDRSPVEHAERIKTPLLILQGSEDRVVPPNQAVQIVEKLKSLNRTVEYVLFEGEGHGFRKGENVKKALETEREFYEKIFRLEAAE